MDGFGILLGPRSLLDSLFASLDSCSKGDVPSDFKT